jgi:hypothetical protein
MLQEVSLDYVQHEERGYCENNPAVIAGTKEQVVDRAVKQLLEALQANSFELDDTILKRGAGWLRYDSASSAWQYSNDAGTTWLPMTQGTTNHTTLTNIGTHTHAQIDTHLDTLPDQVSNPVAIGQALLRTDDGYWEISYDAGVTWFEGFDGGSGYLILTEKMFYPPIAEQETEPNIWNTTCSFWRKPSTGQVWLIFKDSYSVQHKVELT